MKLLDLFKNKKNRNFTIDFNVCYVKGKGFKQIITNGNKTIEHYTNKEINFHDFINEKMNDKSYSEDFRNNLKSAYIALNSKK